MKQLNLPIFKNFTTVEEAIERGAEVYDCMPELLSLDLDVWNSVKVLHDTPEVWRLWLQLGEIRLNLHYILNCNDPFMHFHPWPSIVECVAGGYLHTTAACNGELSSVIKAAEEGRIEAFAEKLTKTTASVVPGSFYVMTDPRQAHSVHVLPGVGANSSVMLTGLPYYENASRLLSRKPPVANPALEWYEKATVINPIRKRWGLQPELPY